MVNLKNRIANKNMAIEMIKSLGLKKANKYTFLVRKTESVLYITASNNIFSVQESFLKKNKLITTSVKNNEEQSIQKFKKLILENIND